MANLKQLRRRIRSAKNIQQITRAMKLVAAARLRKAQDRVLEARPYAEKMRELMASIAEAGSMPEHPLLAQRPIKKYGVILVSADRGLCGSFNTNLLRKCQEFIRESAAQGSVLAVGKKGNQFFSRRNVPIVFNLNLPTSGPTKKHAEEVLGAAQEMFVSGEVDAIYLVYSKFYSAIRQTPEVVQLLPIEPPKSEGKSTQKDYSYEPGATELLCALLPRYALTLILQALLESTASEHGSRMTAMTSATDNAGEMISTLTLQANRSRQTTITTEILEVVGGAEALKG